MNTALDVTSGFCWSIVYLMAMILGFQRKTWYLPKLAICQNFVWELLVVISRVQSGSYGVAFVIQLVWLLLDIGVLITWLRYDRTGRRPWPQKAGLLLAVLAAMYLLVYRAGQWEFAAFLINAIMSTGFVLRTLQDGFYQGSIVIAAAKLVGTLAATILNGWIWWNPVLLWLGGLCFMLDGYYFITILYKKRTGEKF